MAKTLAYYVDQAQAANGGQFDGRTDPVELVNEAGQYLCAMHDWGWLERPAASLDFVANQTYVSLPSDFGKLVKAVMLNNLSAIVYETSLTHIERLRGSTYVDPFVYYVAIAYPAQSGATTLVPNPRLEIWPTPGTSETGAMSAVYLAGWTVLSAMNHVAAIPLDMEPLLLQLVRAYGQAAGRGGIMLQDLLDRIEQGAMVNRLKSSYGGVQGTLGQMMGGAVASSLEERGIYRPYTSISAPA